VLTADAGDAQLHASGTLAARPLEWGNCHFHTNAVSKRKTPGGFPPGV